MKSTNLRNKPVDRRRLTMEERRTYKPQARASALAKARQRKGQMAWQKKVPVGRQEQKPGTGGFTKGLSAQQDRNREEGAKVQRSKQLRATKPVY